MNRQTPQHEPPLPEPERRVERVLDETLGPDAVLAEAGMDPAAVEAMQRRIAGVTGPLVAERAAVEAEDGLDTASQRTSAVAGRIERQRPGLTLGWRIAAMVAMASMVSLVVAVWRVDVTAPQQAIASPGSANLVISSTTDQAGRDRVVASLPLAPLPRRDVDADLDLLAMQVEQIAASDVFVSPNQALDEAIHHDQVMFFTSESFDMF